MTKKLTIPNTPHTIRFPNTLYGKLKQLAQRERRSFNSQVVHMLSMAVLRQEQQQLTNDSYFTAQADSARIAVEHETDPQV